MKYEEMIEYLPPFIARLREMQEIISTEAKEMDDQQDLTFDATDQLFISTATWGLDRWERILNVTRDPDDSYEIRRARLINRTSNIPPATYRALERVVNRFLKNPSARVRLVEEEYRFTVDVDIDDLQHVRLIVEALENMKPAHLAYVLRPAFEERIKIKDTVILNQRRYRRVRELRVGLSVTLDNNEVVLR
ncbi:putative phage tail protein [Halalkalibacterium halodurans]|uniref:Phage portal protein n=1 Tax=Halalkalibacterium halodurans TaxID=86665 RepID=A0A0M0KNC1_ALKHA|nr:putative phage tail protein [Halalkalibacterium halodurans]TPE70677.1 DUF2313 domain-containing protein [Halalkalibacterium halodurans]